MKKKLLVAVAAIIAIVATITGTALGGKKADDIVIGISAALVLAGVAYLGSNADPRTRGSGETTGLGGQKPPPQDPSHQRQEMPRW